MRIRRSDRKGVSFRRMSETTRTIGPNVSRIGAIDTKTLLFAASFLGVGERTMRLTGIGRIKLRDQVCRSGI